MAHLDAPQSFQGTLDLSLNDSPVEHLNPQPETATTRHSRPPVPSSDSLPITDDIVTQFNRRIVKSPQCWFWTGAISTPDGYGRFTWQRQGIQRTLSAHRFALMAAGVDLEGLVAEHRCNEPLCVRVGPEHVSGATQSENLEYAVRNGRHRGTIEVVSSARRAQRSIRIREALRHGWNETAYHAACDGLDPDQLPLF